ncbi:hypothetical protein [Mesorhizobium sp. M0578]|uniref:hypothetical protein n=1 Tax=unclassified Mesorhizobium TaxID=325217 RepID=UPI003335B184
MEREDTERAEMFTDEMRADFQATIDALVAALETARASVAGEWGEDHPEVKDIDAALALARGGKPPA